MRLLIYEHVSGGGFAEKPIPPSILSEGFGMLRTIIEDATAARHAVTTILDSRIAQLNPPLEAERKIPIDSWIEAENAIQEAAESSDAAYIIAPETNGILKTLVEKIEANPIPSINSTPKAISKVSDKTLLEQHAEKIGLQTPKTLAFSNNGDQKNTLEEVIKKIGFPAVFKPVDGVGCEGISLVTSKNQVAAAIARIANQAHSRFMVQDFIQGLPASVTLISNGTNAVPITLNKQAISLKTPNQPSIYNGGTTPIDNPHEGEALETAKNLVESIEGLKGYIGVDLILTKEGPVVIEVNPRLTSSYIGIRKTMNLNLAQSIIDSTLEHKLPKKQKTASYACFEKVKTPNPANAALQQTFNIPEVVSPPFPTSEGSYTYSLICSQGSTSLQAKRNFSKAEKHLNTILLTGGKHER